MEVIFILHVLIGGILHKRLYVIIISSICQRICHFTTGYWAPCWMWRQLHVHLISPLTLGLSTETEYIYRNMIILDQVWTGHRKFIILHWVTFFILCFSSSWWTWWIYICMCCFALLWLSYFCSRKNLKYLAWTMSVHFKYSLVNLEKSQYLTENGNTPLASCTMDRVLCADFLLYM